MNTENTEPTELEQLYALLHVIGTTAFGLLDSLDGGGAPVEALLATHNSRLHEAAATVLTVANDAEAYQDAAKH